MAWLRQDVASRRLIINDAKALVHTVSDTAYLVSPGVFQRYVQGHPQVGGFAKQEANMIGNGYKSALSGANCIASTTA